MTQINRPRSSHGHAHPDEVENGNALANSFFFGSALRSWQLAAAAIRRTAGN
jgi:hypothetical protein